MNTCERAIHARLENHPRFKRVVKLLYQGLGDLVPVKDELPEKPLVVRSGFFFGFHDVCPWSPDDTRLLAHQCSHLPLREPRPEDAVTIGYFVGVGQEDFVPLANTHAFNWQEGSRLQWIGRGDQLIYNTLVRGRALSRRLDANGSELAVYDAPVCTVSGDGLYATSYNFARVRRYDVAYTYAGLRASDEAEAPPGEGLVLLDLASGKTELLCSLRQLSQFQAGPSMDGAYHYVSHCQFSPGAQQLSFMHCWLARGRRYTRLFVYHLESGQLFPFPESVWVSHHCWMSNRRILAYTNTKEGGRRYRIWDCRERHCKTLAGDMLTDDGHPQVDPEQRWLLTDTYPDRFRRQHLILFDLLAERRHSLLCLRVPPSYRDAVRCDFHPRWNRRYSAVCFDSPHTGMRSLCTFIVTFP